MSIPCACPSLRPHAKNASRGGESLLRCMVSVSDTTSMVLEVRRISTRHATRRRPFCRWLSSLRPYACDRSALTRGTH
jgi:hypothetical protein